MHHSTLMNRKKSILQLLCLRQMGLSNARTLSRLVARGLYTGHTPLIAVLNTRVSNSGFDYSSESLCFIRHVSNIPSLYLLKMNTNKVNDMGPVFQLPLNRFNSHERLVGVLLKEESYPYFSEGIPSQDLEPALLMLKQTCLFRLNASNGSFISRHDLSFVGLKMSNWDTSEDDDWLIIQSAKKIIGSSVHVAFVVFQMYPFSFLCCFLVTQNSFCNPNPSLYGTIVSYSSIDLFSTYISVSTTKGYTLLYNFRAYALGLAHGDEVIQKVSSLPCLLVLPGHFSLMAIEAHCGDFTMLYGNEPHSMYLTSVGDLIKYTEFVGFEGQDDLKSAPFSVSHHKSIMKPVSCKFQRELMLQSCGKALKWEERDCNFICSCTADLFPGEFNRLIVKEPGSLRVYQLPPRNECGRDTPLLDNVLLRCGIQKNDSDSHMESYTKSGRRVQRPPQYRRYHVLNNYFCSYTPEFNLVSVLCVQRLATTFLLSTVSFYDAFNFSLLRNLSLNVKVNLDGQDPTSVNVYLSQGIILINLAVDRFHHLLAFRLGIASDSNVELDLQEKFEYQDSGESDSS